MASRTSRAKKKVMMYFLRRVPRDPMFPDASVPASGHLGTAQLQESAHRIRKPATMCSMCIPWRREKGLNGIAYREW